MMRTGIIAAMTACVGDNIRLGLVVSGSAGQAPEIEALTATLELYLPGGYRTIEGATARSSTGSVTPVDMEFAEGEERYVGKTVKISVAGR